MKELTLSELKAIELNILKVFDAFCKEHGIRYFLAYGTLLGAIRYGGFIPWDDDVDVLVPREDYEKLITLFKDSDRYRLFAFEKDSRYTFPFAKLCDMTTLKDEFGYSNEIELGVDIDIFPLDAFDSHLKKAKKEVRIIRRNMMFLGFSKLKKVESANPIKYLAKAFIVAFSKTVGSHYFVRKIQKISYKKEQKGEKYIGCKVWCVYGDRGIIPADAFASSVSVTFEDMTVPAPAGYDTYLTCLYGDYLPEPPKEKQKTHHVFRAYRK